MWPKGHAASGDAQIAALKAQLQLLTTDYARQSERIKQLEQAAAAVGGPAPVQLLTPAPAPAPAPAPPAGAAADQGPEDAPDLLRHSNILRLQRDSPYARARDTHATSRVAALADSLASLREVSGGFADAGRAFGAAGTAREESLGDVWVGG